MKNIPLEKILDQVATTRGINWNETVRLSRLEEGQSSGYIRLTRYSLDYKETIVKVVDYLQAAGYVIVDGHGGFSGFLMRPEEKCLTSFIAVEAMASGHTVSITATGDPLVCRQIRDWFKAEFSLKGAVIQTAVDLDERGRPEFDKVFIPETEAKLAKQSFYPWLSVSLDEYFKAFMASEETVLVMFGPPGTGKSTFLRSLIMSDNYTAYLAYNKKVVESPALIRSYHQSPKARILGYEDIDKHLGKRENDNMLMSSLLNAADGVVQRPEKKLVFVTNLPSIDRIDPALLRVGRCFDILHFRELTRDEAEQVRVDLGLPPLALEGQDKWALSEVLSAQNNARQTINRFGKKIGF